MKLKALITTLALTTAATFAPLAGAADDYITDADRIVKEADWNAMETVTVVFEEHHYTPENLTFKAGVAYKLELINEGEKHHYFTAPEFFRSIATRKAMVNGQAEIKAPYFKAVEVLKEGGQLDLYFVPVTKGTFPVFCTIDDHREKGMEGSIVVE
ncbi:MAG: cupredoxin domain-containing protein [Rhodocyclaceae bacterium]|nr:cupredoxin domain-containing protein [Rhodocyclaceae bacterium]